MEEYIKLHYRYVFFNANYLPFGLISKDEYNAVCLKDLEGMENVCVIGYPLADKPLLLRSLFCLYHSRRVNRILNLPFKEVWYPFYFKDKEITDKPYCFVVARNDIPLGYFDYLRKKYVGCKIIKIHRDLVKVSHRNPDYTEEIMNKVFDLRFTFDKGEANRYNLIHFNEIESRIDVPRDENYPISDVFFAGKAKDRLDKIHKAYKIFTEAGLSCDFFITGVEKNKQIQGKGIEYSGKNMPFREMLYRSINSRCMIDIYQQGADGYTSRILEAIMYNKKIIIDNEAIMDSSYYNPEFMQVVKDVEHIDPSFVLRDVEVNYNYIGEFSPVHLIKKIDDELLRRFA